MKKKIFFFSSAAIHPRKHVAVTVCSRNFSEKFLIIFLIRSVMIDHGKCGLFPKVE
jgi:hypothetical protein